MRKFKAFTLIETLIVIVVFCIGILVVLMGLSQTLRNKEYANTQIQSAFFSREWIELIFNLRDANYHKELPWNCILQSWISPDWCKENIAPWKILKIDIWNGSNYINVEVENDNNTRDLNDDKEFDKVFKKYQIYKHVDNNAFIYNHDSDNGKAEETWFARYLVIKSVDSEGWKLDEDKLLKIESHVLYKRWILKWEKIMETFIWNYEFNQ